MHTHGASAPGMLAWATAVGAALFMGLTVSSRAFFLGAGRKVDMREQPVLFWSLMTVLAAIVAALFGLGLYQLTHAPFH